MNASLLLIPFLLIRFLFLGLIDKKAIQRAALFTPLVGTEKLAYWSYQITTILLLVYPFFLKVNVASFMAYLGWSIYTIGILVCMSATYNFAKPERSGLNTNGLYKFSRNPMYVGYFLYFLAIALLTKSSLFLVIIIVFQLSAHWIILSEERWCQNEFGEDYLIYKRKVRRYI